jgi:hypothetical protein
MPLSRLDLPRIIEAVEELSHTIEHPPTADWQAPAWLVARREPPAWLVALGGAVMDDPPLIQGLNDHAWLVAQCEPQLSAPSDPAHGWLIQSAVSEVWIRTMGPGDSHGGDCPETVGAATWAPWFTDRPGGEGVYVGDGPETAEELDRQRRIAIVRGSRGADCPEIAESSLAMRHKIALVDLRKYVSRYEIGQILAANRIDRLQALVYLESVIETLTDRAPNAALELAPGGFAYRGKVFNLTGRPLDVLKAILKSRYRRCTASELRVALSVNEETVEYPEQVVKDAAAKLRASLTSAAGTQSGNPLLSEGRGKDLTYILSLP